MNLSVKIGIIGLMGITFSILYFHANPMNSPYVYVSPDESKCLSENGTYHNDQNQNECWTGDQNSKNEYLIGCGDNLRQRIFTNKTIDAQLPSGVWSPNCFFISERQEVLK